MPRPSAPVEKLMRLVDLLLSIEYLNWPQCCFVFSSMLDESENSMYSVTSLNTPACTVMLLSKDGIISVFAQSVKTLTENVTTLGVMVG